MNKKAFVLNEFFILSCFWLCTAKYYNFTLNDKSFPFQVPRVFTNFNICTNFVVVCVKYKFIPVAVLLHSFIIYCFFYNFLVPYGGGFPLWWKWFVCRGSRRFHRQALSFDERKFALLDYKRFWAFQNPFLLPFFSLTFPLAFVLGRQAARNPFRWPEFPLQEF